MSTAPVITPEPNLQACNCGQPLAPKAKFCPECGVPRVQASAEVQPKSRRVAAKRHQAADGREPDAAISSLLPAKSLPRKFEPGKSKAVTAQTEKVKSAKSQTQELKSGEPRISEPQTGDSPEDQEPTPAGDEKPSQATQRGANRAAQRAESQAAYHALKSDITEARGKALSTLTGVSSVSMLGLAAFGLISKSWGVLALAAVPFLLTVCFLCWRRDRALTKAEYLSIPHSQGRNGRLRCAHCWDLGASLHESQASHIERYDCSKCQKNLFAT